MTRKILRSASTTSCLSEDDWKQLRNVLRGDPTDDLTADDFGEPDDGAPAMDLYASGMMPPNCRFIHA
jgi:hypothetical protein